MDPRDYFQNHGNKYKTKKNKRKIKNKRKKCDVALVGRAQPISRLQFHNRSNYYLFLAKKGLNVIGNGFLNQIQQSTTSNSTKRPKEKKFLFLGSKIFKKIEKKKETKKMQQNFF